MILKPALDSIAFNLGSVSIRWYGLIMALSIFFGIIISGYIIKKKYSKAEYTIFYDFIPAIIILSIIGARVFYVVGNFSFYINNPTEIIMLNHGGLSIYGAIIFGLASIFIYSKLKKLDMLKYCDAIAIAMPLCQAIGRWGNFINQEAYGAPYNGFLKLYVDTIHRYPRYKDVEFYHPAFLYESVFRFITFYSFNFH